MVEYVRVIGCNHNGEHLREHMRIDILEQFNYIRKTLAATKSKDKIIKMDIKYLEKLY